MQGLDKTHCRIRQSEAEYAAEFFRTVRPNLAQPALSVATEEIANLVVYLCSPAAFGTHGAALRVEGGILKNAF